MRQVPGAGRDRMSPGPAEPDMQHSTGNRTSTASGKATPLLWASQKVRTRGSSWGPGGLSSSALLPLLQTCVRSLFQWYFQRVLSALRSSDQGRLWLTAAQGARAQRRGPERRRGADREMWQALRSGLGLQLQLQQGAEIGGASCRERV